ncbi:MAG: tetratricopeptide (TPR) repeat protein [Myxococcota bacterium]
MLQSVRVSHLASTGRCEEAVNAAEAMPSRDAATELLVGKCSVKAQDYTGALAALDRASNLDPSLVGVGLYRGMSLYHLEDYDEARIALANARVEGEEVALLEFYNGLLLLRNDRPRESALAFERAAARSPERVEPMASYYAALAWQSLDEQEPLNSAIDRVTNQESQGPWAEEAERLMDAQADRHRGGQRKLQRWASIKAGAEYDSNVVLRGGDAPLPSDIDNDNDWRGVWSLVLGSELLQKDRWTLGAMASYSGSAHDDLDQFDQHYVAATGWVDHEFRPTTRGRVRLDFGYGVVNDDPFLFNLNLAFIGEERWGRFGTTTCTLGSQFNDFRYDINLDSGPTYGSRVDQDGIGLDAGCDHEIPVAVFEPLEPTFYGGYRFSNYFAEGVEWKHRAHTVHLGLRAVLPLEVDLDVRAAYVRRDFRQASHFAVETEGEESNEGPDHKENAVQVNVELAKELTDHIVLSGRYKFVDNGSNQAAFDYEQHVGGMYLEYKFP